MRTLYRAVSLVVLGAAPLQGQGGTADRRAGVEVGTWELIGFESRDTQSGAVAYPVGPRPQGLLMYDGARVSVHLFDSERPRFASADRAQGTDAEIRAAFVRGFAYYGTYTVDTTHRTITHHVQGATFPNWMGTDLVRQYEIARAADGSEQLSLRTSPMAVGGQRVVATLLWRRVR